MPKPKTTFKIFAPLLKTSIGADGLKRLHGVASSTVTDRHGDEMSVSALSDMERSAAQNMTIFLNHSYQVPEDVAGSVERASLGRSPQDPDIHDLSLDIVINSANDRAVKAWEAIESGTKLGLSIGAMIPDGGATRKENGAYTIEHVELLETSLVGVPANPRSWVEYAVKALNADGVGEGDLADLEEALATKEIVVEEAIDVCEGCGGSKKKPQKDCESDFHAEAEAEEAEKSVDGEEDGQPTFEGPDEDAPLPEVEIASTSASAAPEDEPDKTNATVSVETEHAKITVDTGNRGKAPDGASQEAQASAPENEEKADDDAHWADSVGLTGEPIEGEDLRAALQVLEPTVTATLKTSTELIAALTSELDAAHEERDEAMKAAAEALAVAKETLDMVAATPAGRRATIPAAQKKVAAQASSLEAVYGKSFVDTLRKDT